jgi:ABC-2 type transport system permease protein
MIANVFSRKNRILLKELVVTDFKLRYQGSVLGYLWSLLKPLLLFAILYLVFVKFLRFGADVEHFPIYLLIGIVLWGFFTEATIQGMHSIIGRGDVIRKINFPKYIIVVSSTISALINLAINLAVVLVFMLVAGVSIRGNILLVPLNIAELYALALSIAFLLSALMVKYRDVVHVWEVILQALFYAVPIIYPLGLVIGYNETVARIMLLNPIAQIIQDVRYNMVSEQAVTVGHYIDNPIIQLIPYLIILLLIIFASLYFRNNSRYFAENL